MPGNLILGIGNPLLDISAEVPQSVLDKYDLKMDNAILAEEKHMPIYQELQDSYKVQYIAGGATQNSIRVAQWMTGKEDACTAFMGAVGEDKLAKTLSDCAAADGVQTHYYVDAETPTGTCAVLVKDGERSLCANLSAANKFVEDHLSTEKALELLEGAQIVYIAGFFLTVSVPSLVRVGKHCVENNKTFCMNLSAPFLIDFFGEQMAAALPFTDFIFANESEAEAFGKKQEWGSDLKEVALKLAAMPKASGTRCRTVVFTQGSQSTLVASNGTVTEYAVTPLGEGELVDTNGAGDAFVGGFLALLRQGADIAKCVDAGHFAAGEIIKQSGCTFPETCSYSA